MNSYEVIQKIDTPLVDSNARSMAEFAGLAECAAEESDAVGQGLVEHVGQLAALKAQAIQNQ